MERCARQGNPSVQIDLTTLTDDDIDMSPDPILRISDHKRREIRNICKSGFGSEFMVDHSADAESEHANFSTLLQMLRRNQFASVDEVKREAICFLHTQVKWFQNPANKTSNATHQNSEMIVMAENLKQRFVDLVDDDSNAEERHTQSQPSTEEAIVEKLCEIFPHLHHSSVLPLKVNHYLVESVNNNKSNEKDIDVDFAVNEISQEILNMESGSDGPTTSSDQQGPLQYLLCAPENGKYHNFDEQHQNHFYVAASQFYKMLLKGKPPIGSKTIENQSDAIASIEYVVNPKTLKTFSLKKKLFLDNKRGLNNEGKVKELLLFHGTDTGNVDSIMENNFEIDAVPNHKRKAMVYGRGVYMSEHPEVAFSYGDKLLLCRVLPGEVERVEMNQGAFRGPSRDQISATHDSREMLQSNMGVIHVIKDEAQILPYCIIHLTRGQLENAFSTPSAPPFQSGFVHTSNFPPTPTINWGNAQSNMGLVPSGLPWTNHVRTTIWANGASGLSTGPGPSRTAGPGSLTGPHGPAGPNAAGEPNVTGGSNSWAVPSGTAGANGLAGPHGTSGQPNITGQGQMIQQQQMNFFQNINSGAANFFHAVPASVHQYTGNIRPTGAGPTGSTGLATTTSPSTSTAASLASNTLTAHDNSQIINQQNLAVGSSTSTQGSAVGRPPTVVNGEEYERRVLVMKKYLLPLQQEIKNNPTHTKLQKLLEIISKPKKRLVPMVILDQCEETLKKKFGR